MALSNWDTFMMDEKGKSISGYWESPLGVGVEIYKNWIHIHDKKVWKSGKYSYTEPIIMMIESGKLEYKDIKILALRGLQKGIFVVVWTDIYSNNYEKHKIVGAVGTGVYAYTNSGRFIGVTKKSLKWFHKELNRKEKEYDTFEEWFKNGKKKKDCKVKFYHSVHHVPDVFKNMELLTGVRYNQGDMYLAGHLKFDVPVTEPGKAEDAIFSKAIKNMNK